MNGYRCADCGKEALIGLNGVLVCLVDFNARMIEEGKKLDALKQVMRNRGL